MRRVALAILALTASLWAEQAGQKPVEARARLAFRGFYRSGWIPVLVDNLRNLTGQEVDLEVQIDGGDGMGGSGSALPDSVAWISLPRQEMAGRKRLFLYFYDPGGWCSLKLKLRKRGDKEPFLEQVIDGNQFNSTGVVVLSDKSEAEAQIRTALNYNTNSTSYYYNQPTPLVCPTELMPDRWIAYSQADLVVLAGFAWDKVEDKAWKALVEWVRSGGTVLISPTVDEGWFRDPHLKDLCDPGTVQTGTADLGKSGFGPSKEVPYARYEKGDALLPTGLADRSPFLRHYRAEFGHVYLMATDLTAQPYLGWGGLAPMWANLYGLFSLVNPHDLMDRGQGESMSDGSYYRREDQGFPMRRAVGHGMRSLPDMWGLVALIVGFVLAVGPINYFVLKKLQRPLWTMWTIPSVSLLFVGSIVAMGYLTKGTSTAVQRVSFVDLVAGSEFVVESRHACVRAAAPGDYDLQWDPLTYPRALRPAETSYRITQGAEFAIRGFPLHMWEEGYFRGDSVRRVRGTIDLARDGDGVVTATNRTGRNVRTAVYVDTETTRHGTTAGSYWVLGPIAAGATVRSAGPSRSLPPENRGEAVSDGAGLGGLDRAVMAYLLDSRFVHGNEPPMLLAFVDGDTVSMTLAGRNPQEARTLTVYRVFQE